MKIRKSILNKLRLYWPLIKSLQAGLLLATGLAGFSSIRCPITNWQLTLEVLGSLFLAISGSTILNMVYDHDIDTKMERTRNRPLPSGKLSLHEACWLGVILSGLGIGWAVLMAPLYGAVVFAGWFFDVVVYTIWLKRRTPWSVIWGGLAGGMPALAGRVFGLGQIDWIGILLVIAIVFWIPLHIMTLHIRYQSDYQRAGIPTFPTTYGLRTTRLIIVISSLIATATISLVVYALGSHWGYLHMVLVFSGGLFILAILSIVQPSEKLDFVLFKYASLYMLSSMMNLVVQAI